jgi:L-ascorbate metabolism protein UlaG (beta-lactamase superfamily)
MTTLTYLGTNTLLFRKGDAALLIDPHFTRPGLLALFGKLSPKPRIIREALHAIALDNCLGIALTHTHYDHALDAPETARQTGGLLIGSDSAINLARGADLEPSHIRAVAAGDSLSLGPFLLQFHPARHLPFPLPLQRLLPPQGKIAKPLRPPARMTAYQAGATFALQVNSILIFGSAGFEPGACDGLSINTVTLSVGGLELRPQTYLDRLYKETVLASCARQVFLSHWDNFLRPFSAEPRPLLSVGQSIHRLKALGEKHGQRIRTLPIKTPVEIPKG